MKKIVEKKQALSSSEPPVAPASGDGKLILSERAAQILATCKRVVAKEEYLPKNGLTFCNQAFQEIMAEYGWPIFQDMLANDIYLYMASSMRFERIAGELAQDYANKGYLTASAWLKLDGGHGHCAMVCPGEMIYSPTWDKMAPWVANVGVSNGIMPASKAYKQEPDYFVLISKNATPR